MKNFLKYFLNKFPDKILNKTLEIFFPEECISCKKINETICEGCLNKIKNYPPKKNLNLDWVSAKFNYENQILKNSLFSLKYHHNKSVAKYLGKISFDNFYEYQIKIQNSIPSPTITDRKGEIQLLKQSFSNLLILPIPISKKRLRERNYNQSEVLIREILKNILEKYNLNLEENLKTDFLIKNKNTIKFSHTHDQSERQDLIKDVFEINNKYFKNNNLKNIKIILIDDITTTGSTFYEARKTLMDFGFQKENIFAFALAH